MIDTIVRIYSRGHSLQEAVKIGIEENIKKVSTFGLYGNSSHTIIDSSSQIVGFEDVRIQVEEKLSKEYKEELENKIREYENAKERYNRKYNSLDKEYHEAHRKEIDEINKVHEEEVQRLNIEHEALTKSLQNKIDTLSETVKELSKSKEDKIAELTAIIKEAEAKMQELNGPRKGFFNKIFG